MELALGKDFWYQNDHPISGRLMGWYF